MQPSIALVTGVARDAPTSLRARTRYVLGSTGAVLIGYSVALAVLGWRSGVGHNSRAWLVIFSTAAGAVYLIGLGGLGQAVVTRRTLTWIIVAGAVMRLVIALAPPLLESDFYRYLWDGAVVAHGYNPYRYSPDEVRRSLSGNDTLPAPLRDLGRAAGPVLERVNHPELRTIYPPVAQAAFGLAALLMPWSVYGWRIVLLLCDAATLALLFVALRTLGRPVVWLAWYWWNPLYLHHIVQNAHMDALVLPLVLVSILLAGRRRYVLSAGTVALAAGVKVWPLVLLPLVLRPVLGKGKTLAAALLVVGIISAVLWWPVALAPWDASSGFHAYAQSWENNDAIFSAVVWTSRQALVALGDEHWHTQTWARRIVAGLTLLWVLRVTWRPPTSTATFLRAARAIAAGVFLLSPAQFPWYFLWLLPLLAVTPRLSLLLYAALLPLYYLHYQYPWLVWVQHLPVCVLLIVEAIWQRRPAWVGSPREAMPHAA